MRPLAGRLSERASLAGLTLDDSIVPYLLDYYDLLLRWNAKINLTSLTDRDEAIDRLLIEPVAAATNLPGGARMMDLGSGGGSPAIPLALALGAPSLVMVESKGRKAAFLREAARQLGLKATVETGRFEMLAAAGSYAAAFDVVSMRAVRMDLETLTVAGRFVSTTGQLALFISSESPPDVPSGFHVRTRRQLVRNAELLSLGKTFHVEQ